MKNNNKNKTRFYIKICNGASGGAFGIRFFLNENRDSCIFDLFTDNNSDCREWLFKNLVDLENNGVLEFTFEIFDGYSFISQSFEPHPFSMFVGQQDCRIWLRDLHHLRKRLLDIESNKEFPCFSGFKS